MIRSLRPGALFRIALAGLAALAIIAAFFVRPALAEDTATSSTSAPTEATTAEASTESSVPETAETPDPAPTSVFVPPPSTEKPSSGDTDTASSSDSASSDTGQTQAPAPAPSKTEQQQEKSAPQAPAQPPAPAEQAQVAAECSPSATLSDDGLQVSQDTSGVVDVSLNDSVEACGGNVTYSPGPNGAAHGTIQYLGYGQFQYTPETGFYGTDTFEYVVSVGGIQKTASVNVFVTSTFVPVVNLVDDTATVVSGQEVLIDFEANDTVTFQNYMNVSISVDGKHGNFVIADGGGVYTSDAGYVGTDTVKYRVTVDNDPTTTKEATITITVTAPVPTVVDTDGDGVPDSEDAFPDDPNESQDTDGDGVGDNADKCAITPANTPVDANGCEVENPSTDPEVSGKASFAVKQGQCVIQLNHPTNLVPKDAEFKYGIDGEDKLVGVDYPAAQGDHEITLQAKDANGQWKTVDTAIATVNKSCDDVPTPVINPQGEVMVKCTGEGVASLDNSKSTVEVGYELGINGEVTLYTLQPGEIKTIPFSGAEPGSTVVLQDGNGVEIDSVVVSKCDDVPPVIDTDSAADFGTGAVCLPDGGKKVGVTFDNRNSDLESAYSIVEAIDDKERTYGPFVVPAGQVMSGELLTATYYPSEGKRVLLVVYSSLTGDKPLASIGFDLGDCGGDEVPTEEPNNPETPVTPPSPSQPAVPTGTDGGVSPVDSPNSNNDRFVAPADTAVTPTPTAADTGGQGEEPSAYWATGAETAEKSVLVPSIIAMIFALLGVGLALGRRKKA